MPQNVDPRVDYAFKKLFGRERNKILLIDLLSAVMREEIVDVEPLNPINDRDFEDDKESILDLQARLADGRIVFVEMQMWMTSQFANRMLYYWTQPFVRQISKGEPYGVLKPVIGIYFVNEVMFPKKPAYHHRFRIVADGDPELVLTPLLQIHLIELPKFHVASGDLTDKLDRWCYLFNNGSSLDLENVPEGLQMHPLEKAIEELSIMSFTEAERQRYDARMKTLHDLASYRYDSLEEGRLEGRVEGERTGLNKARDNLRNSIQSVTRAKFGPQSASVIETIRSVEDESKLIDINAKLALATTLEEFRKALG